ncbi:MAG: formimidoylglutamate deiminase [Alphaproteobacteria bacterium]
MRIFSNRAWLSTNWIENVRVTIDDGVITEIERSVSADPTDIQIDTLLPAQANLHSHSFQRAMAGMTEYRAAGRDSFWTWRTLMYKFLDHLTPVQMEAIAALVFMEMQEAGYASVGEFHYVHHQPGGQFYDNRSELSARILSAALKTGIGLTHLPVLYTYGGVEKAPLTGGQKRFGNSVDEFFLLLEEIELAMIDTPADYQLGIAPHSLRATSPAELSELISRHEKGPIHMHIAEQPREVLEVSHWLGQRPVEWLLEHHDVTPNWCLIHATHMTNAETKALAQSGAVVGLCPITEANLGDGPFNGATFVEAGGTFGIGSDSDIRISVAEELRTLEYSQRMRDLNRNILVKKSGSVGQNLYLNAATGSAQALNRNAGRIETGFLADLVAIDSTSQYLCALTPEQLFDGFCFAADGSVVTDLWSAGRHMVQDGRHIERDKILTDYRVAIRDLTGALNSA